MAPPGKTTGVPLMDCCTPRAEKFRTPEILSCPPAPMKKRRSLSAPNGLSRKSPTTFFTHPDIDMFFLFAFRNGSNDRPQSDQINGLAGQALIIFLGGRPVEHGWGKPMNRKPDPCPSTCTWCLNTGQSLRRFGVGGGTLHGCSGRTNLQEDSREPSPLWRDTYCLRGSEAAEWGRISTATQSCHLSWSKPAAAAAAVRCESPQHRTMLETVEFLEWVFPIHQRPSLVARGGCGGVVSRRTRSLFPKASANNPRGAIAVAAPGSGGHVGGLRGRRREIRAWPVPPLPPRYKRTSPVT
ncbi:hypothetical protein NL676_016873 [Syzygium grande]|nr:hypothetical protein NL676_016873 [Syzygium grande]